jgi:hypothetical protein
VVSAFFSPPRGRVELFSFCCDVSCCVMRILWSLETDGALRLWRQLGRWQQQCEEWREKFLCTQPESNQRPLAYETRMVPQDFCQCTSYSYVFGRTVLQEDRSSKIASLPIMHFTPRPEMQPGGMILLSSFVIVTLSGKRSRIIGSVMLTKQIISFGCCTFSVQSNVKRCTWNNAKTASQNSGRNHLADTCDEII